MGWTSPTGFVDPSSHWDAETTAYDENIAFGANCNTTDNPGGYLELTHAAIDCDKVRCHWNIYRAETINIDVYYSSAWHNIFTGTRVNDSWQEYAIGSTQSLTAMRVRMTYSDPGIRQLEEADFGEIDITPKAGSDTGSGVEAKATNNPLATYSRDETGSGTDTKAAGNPLATLVKSETGSGVDASSLLAALVKAESGSGVDALVSLLAELVKAETGSGVEASSLLAELTKDDIGTAIDHLEEQIAEYGDFKLAPFAYGKKRYVRRT